MVFWVQNFLKPYFFFQMVAADCEIHEPKEHHPSSILSQFWDLASFDVEKRSKATEKLLAVVQETLDSEIEIKTKTDIEKYPEDVRYALKRLLKGLSSSRDAARQGFAVALAELLNVLLVPVSVVLELLHEYAKNNGTKTGQEEREWIFARLFGYQAIAHSGSLSRHCTNVDDIVVMVDAIVEFGKTKDYLRQACASVLISLLQEVFIVLI